MRKFLGYLLIVIGAIVMLTMVTTFIDLGLKDNTFLGLIIFFIGGALLIRWGRNLLRNAKLETPREYPGYWKAKCGWFIFGGIALAGIAVVGWVSLPPAGFVATLLSFKLFQSAHKAYYD